MKCEETRRVPAPGGASPRGLLSLPAAVAVEAEEIDFRHRAGAVLARRNRRDLAMASGERPPVMERPLLRRIGTRQKMQLELLMGRGAL